VPVNDLINTSVVVDWTQALDGNGCGANNNILSQTTKR
jgi:hypothetical protein